MYSIRDSYLQKYIQGRIKETDRKHTDYYNYTYECTVTFNQSYWSLRRAMQAIPEVVADILKPIVRELCSSFYITYAIEYHRNGYPHLHAQIFTGVIDIEPETQRNLTQRLCRRYGRSQWYQTGIEDKLHVNEQFPEGIYWSEYIKKDRQHNEEKQLKHYFNYQIG